MPEKDDKLLKMMTQDAKKLRQKKARGTGVGDYSGSAGSPRVNLDERSPKKARHAKTARKEPSNLRPDRAFVLPPCFKDGGYFEKFPLVTSPDEACRVDEMDSPTLLKQLASDGAAVMRVLGMAQ